MINAFHTAVLLALVSSVLGCGTFLAIGERPAEAKKVPGFAVNERADFDVTLGSRREVTCLLSDCAGPTAPRDELEEKKVGTISGIEPRNVVTVNTRRMPFATGKLIVKLTGNQTLKEVSLVSETGAARAAGAADSALSTKSEIEKLKDAD